jgi:ATP-dependent exoDNAse (exonuclease V) alpha subunit
MLDLIFDGWLTDTGAGLTSLMLAADAETVAELNSRAQAHRVAAGEVNVEGVRLADGTTIGVGDVVVTRLNRRALVTGRGWVKNGDDWIVQAVDQEGSVRVRRGSGGEVAVLPPDYVADHVELGYATTAHRAQGRTVDTTHSYVTATTVREPLYVMATRGRESNRLYVDTANDPDVANSHEEPGHVEALDVLRSAIETSGADISASEVREKEEAASCASWRIEAECAYLDIHVPAGDRTRHI